jgi:hypothetical protein
MEKQILFENQHEINSKTTEMYNPFKTPIKISNKIESQMNTKSQNHSSQMNKSAEILLLKK